MRCFKLTEVHSLPADLVTGILSTHAVYRMARFPQQAVLLQSGYPFWALHSFLPGTRIQHPTRGLGVLADVISVSKRDKPYKIVFDNGEVTPLTQSPQSHAFLDYPVC